ncbi:MAG: pyridoxal-phosphate dependent enzyme [Cytophagales bacterium]|nr:pyridoxal-phosphate dependent enzyme [Cytophagales bacterium]
MKIAQNAPLFFVSFGNPSVSFAMKRLNATQIEAAFRTIDPVFLHTPQYECEPLGNLLGCRVLLKVETQNPIRSFKGRGADFLVSQLADEPLICASAGNFGQAMAYACRKRGIPLTIYASVQANPYKIERMRALQANVVLYGDDFDAAKEQAKTVAARGNIRFVEDGLDVETLVGAGTMGLELLGLPQSVDCLLIPLGNGALFNGVATVFKAHRPQTKIIAVQAAGAPAMIESWRQETLVNYSKIQTIADGIGVRSPIPQALEDMEGLADDGLLVSETSILQAMKHLHQYAGLVVEPSGAVGIAAVIENPALFADKTVTTIICGGNLTQAQMTQWL